MYLFRRARVESFYKRLDDLIRLSVGVEDLADLRGELEMALA